MATYIYNYALKATSDKEWGPRLTVHSNDWKDEGEARAGLEKQFPGNAVHVKLQNVIEDPKPKEVTKKPNVNRGYEKGLIDIKNILGDASTFKQCTQCGKDLALKRKLKVCKECNEANQPKSSKYIK